MISYYNRSDSLRLQHNIKDCDPSILSNWDLKKISEDWWRTLKIEGQGKSKGEEEDEDRGEKKKKKRKRREKETEKKFVYIYMNRIYMSELEKGERIRLWQKK